MTNKLFRATLGIAASLLLSTNAFASVVNAGFEDPDITSGVEVVGAAGWEEFGAVFTITDAVVGPAGAFEGDQVLKIFGGVSGVFQDFAASEGQVWEASAWALNDSADAMTGGQIAAVNIEFFDDMGNQLDVAFGSALDASSPLDTWTLLSAMGTAPMGTATARIVLITGEFAGPGGGAVRFDAASFGVVPIPGAVWLLGSAMFGLMGFRRARA